MLVTGVQYSDFLNASDLGWWTLYGTDCICEKKLKNERAEKAETDPWT